MSGRQISRSLRRARLRDMSPLNPWNLACESMPGPGSYLKHLPLIGLLVATRTSGAFGARSFVAAVPFIFGCLSAACESGSLVETGLSDDGGQQRGLTILVGVAPEFEQEAQALGWLSGVPGVEVRLHRVTTPITDWLTATTDSSGVVRFPDLLPGQYRVVASRLVEGSEASPIGGAARALADGQMYSFVIPDSITLRLAVDGSDGLGFSEIYAFNPEQVVDYDYAQYYKIHNNSSRTIYLDGKLLGQGFHLLQDGAFFTCELTEPFRVDSEGLWIWNAHRFPGGGSEYPIQPGEEKIVALDAIDHRQFSQFGMDLSSADFELLGTGDVDNPAVPNLPELGPNTNPRVHGMWISAPSALFISDAVDVSTLPRMEICGVAGCSNAARIPDAAVLEVVTLWNDGLLDDQGTPCPLATSRRYDRLPGGFQKCCSADEIHLSVQRRELRTEGGRRILMDTNTSAADFVKAPRTIR